MADVCPRLLSIQSHVVSGYAGNKSATLPLQLLDFEVDAINSVQFSNHTGYPAGVQGHILDSEQLDQLMQGLGANQLDRYDYALSGYIGSASFLRKLAHVVAGLKQKNCDLVFACDPVMGDTDQGWYVPKDLLPIYRQLILPMAKLCFPNQFELEVLSGTTIRDREQAFRAMDVIHDLGVDIVVLTSSQDHSAQDLLTCLVSARSTRERWSIQFPKLDANFVGTGDLFAALCVAWYHRSGGSLKVMLENTVASIQAVLRKTLLHCPENPSPKDLELKLIQSKQEIITAAPIEYEAIALPCTT